MTGNAEEMELKDRLSLIETMIAEGRRTTESWGWTFVLLGRGLLRCHRLGQPGATARWPGR